MGAIKHLIIYRLPILLLLLFFSAVIPNTSIADVDLIQPEDLEYRGAFRLPDVTQGSDWNYSGYGMTFYPAGDATGPSDGYSGSLFAVGHDQGQMIAEISIPVPVISPSKNLEALNTAVLLQPFTDIRSALFGYMDLPSPGIEYLPAQGSQSVGKLHFCWSQWIQTGEASHGWCDLDLSDPQIAGPWLFGAYSNYLTNDFIFEIPDSWSREYTPGLRLVSGRYREGQWSGGGPSLFAYGPWNDGNPPATGSTLTNITALLSYGSDLENSEVTFDATRTINNYNLVDTFAGGAWLTSGEKAAVVLCGTKGTGDCWYGYGNGVEYPYLDVDENTVYPEIPDWPYNDRGFWSDGIEAQLIFYSPDDLAGVVRGTMVPSSPQPYAVMTLDAYLFDGASIDYVRAKKHLLGAIAFDRANGIFYIMERRADEEKSVVHVFQIVSSGGGSDASDGDSGDSSDDGSGASNGDDTPDSSGDETEGESPGGDDTPDSSGDEIEDETPGGSTDDISGDDASDSSGTTDGDSAETGVEDQSDTGGSGSGGGCFIGAILWAE